MKISDIKLGTNWSRTSVGDVRELAESMAQHGQITPVIVDSSGKLVAGYRRLAAAESLGWTDIDVVINDREATVINLVENMNRQDLTLWEEIKAINSVFGDDTPVAEIARALSKSRKWVAPRREAWSCPPDFLDKIRMGHANITDLLLYLKRRQIERAEKVERPGRRSNLEINRVVTNLMAAGREAEARALSFALGAVSEEELTSPGGEV